MKRIIFVFLVFIEAGLKAQIISPDEFLGYQLGDAFTPHHKVLSYFKQVASRTSNMKLISYGKTYEGRELIAAIISDQENIDRLEQIRKNNLALAVADKTAKTNMPAILWMSYNVHGNEASSTETAMKVLYTLANGDGKIKQWLKNVVVIIDPCLNPDGRDRYVNHYNEVKGLAPNPDPSSREHSEPWPGGRPNHYHFDLNRDWAWQTQIETQQRLALYHQWMPEVHVDFHEQSYNDPYYFAPAAEPVHQDITTWQKEFQVVVGKNNARYFDEQGWKYFTKERFDLLYPSYGDTYPLYNGAIGMTYEQGGIRAGLAVITSDGDTLTLKDRILHHFTTSISTLETVSANQQKLVAEFKKYFSESATGAGYAYKTYVVKAQNLARLSKLAELLEKNHIAYSFGADKTLSGFNYASQKTENFKVERNDLIVNLQQPRSVLANVLFEPQTKILDSNTYDITAWALPYLYGLNAYATKESFSGNYAYIEKTTASAIALQKPYAFIVPWQSMEDAKVLISLQREKVKVRMADEAFTIGGVRYAAGTLLVYRAENEKVNGQLTATLKKVEQDFNVMFRPLATGYVEKGKDFGSSAYRLLTPPKVAMAVGDDLSASAVGEIWYYFEQELGMPVMQVNTRTLAYADLSAINVLILPDGNYTDKLAEQLQPWVSKGGRLILMEEAIGAFIDKKDFGIKRQLYAKEEDKNLMQTYVQKERFDNSIPGAIYAINMDATHPMSVAIGNQFYAIKGDVANYGLLQDGRNVGTLSSSSYIAGIAGSNARKKLTSGMQLAVQKLGKGSVVYFAVNPLFRCIAESGKQLFNNSLFLAN